VLEETWNNYQPGTRRPYGLMEWPALLRKLDRMDPELPRLTSHDKHKKRQGDKHDQFPPDRPPRCSCKPLARLLLAPLRRLRAIGYPNKPVRVVVAFTAGGTTDILARAVGQKLADRFKQPFVIDNKPGGGGNIGTELVARAAPDGYTLIVNSVGPMAVNPSLYKKLNFNPLVDLVPVVQIADVPNVLVVHPSLPAKTFDEFVAYMRPTRASSITARPASAPRRTCPASCWASASAPTATHVPYKGADRAERPAGRADPVHVRHHPLGDPAHPGRQAARAGGDQREALALDARRADGAGARVPRLLAGSWFGFFAPKGTPLLGHRQLNKAVNDTLPSLERR
jgi:hypothetical protein